MEYSSYESNVTALGTSYFPSSIQYLGCSAYGSTDQNAGLDLKPNVMWAAKQELGMSDQWTSQLQGLGSILEQLDQGLEKYKQQQELFSAEFKTSKEQKLKIEFYEREHGAYHPQVKQYREMLMKADQELKTKYDTLNKQREDIVKGYTGLLDKVKLVQEQILGWELMNWRRQQQRSGNGFPVNSNLDKIEDWCVLLGRVVWPLREQVEKAAQLFHSLELEGGGGGWSQDDALVKMQASAARLVSDLVSGSFIVERQPPQVMKTNARFSATVRLLGGVTLNMNLASLPVSACMVNDTQAQNLFLGPEEVTKTMRSNSAGDLLNGTGSLELHEASQCVSATLRNLQLKKIRRTEKKSTESVMDEKFAMLFVSEFHVKGCRFQILALSAPIVVIVHGNQESQALATVTWDNAFAKWNRKLFEVPDCASWLEVGQALNMKWTDECGGPLTEENLYCLACKAFGNENLPRDPQTYNSLTLTWHQFCKENLVERGFTFWEWFYRALCLTSNHLSSLWKAGYVMGFISKTASNMKLMGRPQHGTFLLRFSDSELGGVTIFHIKYNLFQQPEISMVLPFTGKHLTQRPLVSILFDIKDLCLLYPDVRKEDLRVLQPAEKSESGSSASSSGYVKHTLVTQVEEGSKFGGGDGSSIASSSVGSPPRNRNALESMDYFQPQGKDLNLTHCISSHHHFDTATNNNHHHQQQQQQQQHIDIQQQQLSQQPQQLQQPADLQHTFGIAVSQSLELGIADVGKT